MENETRAVSEVCQGHCKYVCEVLGYGWLGENNSYYFIDMEYCNWTLEDYIRGLGRNPYGQGRTLENDSAMIIAQSGGHRGPGIVLEDEQLALNEVAFDHPEAVQTTHLEPFSDDEIDWEGMGTVLDHILTGLIYIHGKGIVHRDLKPRNGTNVTLNPCSTPLTTYL